jgi:transposase
MQKKERQQFDPSFKIKIVKLILSKEKKISELARELNINENTLHVWKRKYLESSAKAIQETVNPTVDVNELKKLYKDLASVKEENDILKKALGIFTRQM